MVQIQDIVESNGDPQPLLSDLLDPLLGTSRGIELENMVLGWRRLTIGALLVLAPLSACSADPPVVDTTEGLEYASGYFDEAWNRLLDEHEERVAECMRSRGFKFWTTSSKAHMTLGPHGLFGLTTPSSELEYLSEHGYGVVHRVAVLKSELEASRLGSNDVYVEGLSPGRKEEYGAALLGGEQRAGCANAESGTVVRLGLPDGGELGDAFAKSLDEARESRRYEEWQTAVITCLEEVDVEVPSDDLTQMERPFLQRLLDLAGSDYTTLEDGRIEYELSARNAIAIKSRDLRDLRQAEMETAAAEADCRRSAGAGAQEAVDAASAPLVAQFSEEVELLNSALTDD